MSAKRLFVSTPISAFTSNAEYLQFKGWLERLLDEVESSGIASHIFSAARKVDHLGALEEPENAVVEDLEQLNAASHFLLIYPRAVATSALIELGYAMGREMTIVIVHPKSANLPFLADRLEFVFNNVHRACISRFDYVAIATIVDLLRTAFKL